MREVEVRKVDLLTVLKKNREQHVKDYLEACAGYKEAALAKIEDVSSELKARIGRLKDGQVIALVALQFNLEVPKSFEKAYDQAIVMLEMSVDDTVTLEESEFAQYVMDDWEWKEQFTMSNRRYSNK